MNKTLLALCVLFIVSLAHADESLDKMFSELQSPQTATKAVEKWETAARHDAVARAYLAAHLPALIEQDPRLQPEVWTTAVKLAGNLALQAAAPALAHWIGLNTGGTTTFAQYERLENNLPAKALVQIGDPAVPAVRDALEQGNLRQREIAIRTLKLIGTEIATAALRAHLAREPEQRLRKMILQSIGGNISGPA